MEKILFLYLSIVFLLTLSGSKAQVQKWVTIQVDTVASVEFPDQPIFRPMDKVQVYFLQDRNVFFAVLIMNGQADETPSSELHDFYLGFMDSMVGDKNGTLTDSAVFKINSTNGFDFSYTSTEPDGRIVGRRHRAILIKDKLYCWGFTTPIDNADSSKDVTEKFLESFEISK